MKLTEKITVNTQSSIKIELDKIIRIDPFKIDGEPKDADVIFITHPHFDHFSKEDLIKVVKLGTAIYIPEKTMDKAVEFGFTGAGLQEKGDFKGCELITVNAGDTFTWNDINVEVVPAYNITTPNPKHLPEFGWVGYVLEIPFEGQTYKLYAAGDTDVIPEQENIDCDIAMIPVGGTFTMDENEAAALINKKKPAVVIPIHYGSVINDPQTGDRFAAQIDKDTEVILKLFK